MSLNVELFMQVYEKLIIKIKTLEYKIASIKSTLINEKKC